MASRGFLIRFIDIGLIVLFGFVLISDIENASRVELSAAGDARDERDDSVERIFITVGIAPDGSFTVVSPESGGALAADIAHADALTELLRRLKEAHAAEGRELVVLINPHEDSVVQRTVDVMDVCDRLGLGKSLQMDVALRENGCGVSECVDDIA